MDPVAEIKARLPIEELVREYCAIQQKGRMLKAVCPFHNDTHPSLLISPQKGVAYCFACQSGGDIFSFYQKIENVDFRQALKDLAEKTGVDLPREPERKSLPRDERERFRTCLEAAVAFYATSLLQSDRAKQYLAERRVTPELVEKFQIGFAPDSFDATYTHLLREGFSRKEILGAGLGVQKDLKEERIYDRFRNRIMFPITDHQGNLIGFGGRTLGEDAKYINSPDGPLYNKSTALFGLFHAKEAIRKEKSIVLVEGYFDVLACHRIGIENVVAVSGTALTEPHTAILKRYSDRVLLCLDADIAGTQAAERAFLLCSKHELAVYAVTIPEGKDPDECALRNPEELRKRCTDGGEPYLDRVLREMAHSRPEKRQALEHLLPLLQAIPSAVEREEAIRKAASMLQTSVTALEDDLKRMQATLGPASSGSTQAVLSPFSTTEHFLGLLLCYPMHLPLAQMLIGPEQETERALHQALCALAPQSFSHPIGSEHLPDGCRERASILMLYCEEHFGSWSEDLAGKELRKLLRKANRDALTQKQKQLLEHIRVARREGHSMEEEQLLTQYHQVLKLTAMTS